MRAQGFLNWSPSSQLKSHPPLHKIKDWTTTPYSKTTQLSKDHFSVLQQHRGQQRLAVALIVAPGYLPVSFSCAPSPQGSRERRDLSVKETDLSRRLGSPRPPSAKHPHAQIFRQQKQHKDPALFHIPTNFCWSFSYLLKCAMKHNDKYKSLAWKCLCHVNGPTPPLIRKLWFAQRPPLNGPVVFGWIPQKEQCAMSKKGVGGVEWEEGLGLVEGGGGGADLWRAPFCSFRHQLKMLPS